MPYITWGYNAFEALTVSTLAVSLTPAVYGARERAFITVEDAAIRFRFDGGAPTATVGHAAEPGDLIELLGEELAAFKAIRRDGVDAELQVSYGS